MHKTPHLLIIGGASLDTLHFKNETVLSVGGAGMYTAMAARKSGVDVTMLSPKMDPESKLLTPVSDSLTRWIGPKVSPEEFPNFEIAYMGNKTEYLNIFLDAESALSTEMLPQDLSIFDLIHVVPLSHAEKQLSFIQECIIRGAKKISAGTGLFIVKAQLSAVKEVIELSDLFFMNRTESEAIYGDINNVTTKTGKVLFITDGPNDVTIVQGNTRSNIPSPSTKEVDPTGAGDTFCGATLSQIINNNHPIASARYGALLASKMIENIGPTELLSKSPAPFIQHQSVAINEKRIHLIAESLSKNNDVAPFNFMVSDLPNENDSSAIDYFFITTLHQFGFWYSINDTYSEPMIALLDGTLKKGSDYLWRSFLNILEKDVTFFTAERQANVTPNELMEIFYSDDRQNPMPAFSNHVELCQQYGQDMLTLGLTPNQIVDNAQSSSNPLKTLIFYLDQISGYKEDPLRKKSNLLALILNQRPERFLQFGVNEQVPPIIDYHVIRSCLRMGLIEITDKKLKQDILDRRILTSDQEWAIRHTAHLAFEKLVEMSGKSLGAVDIFFFEARKRCPEMTIPECEKCSVELVCAQKKELFQPVYRTTFY